MAKREEIIVGLDIGTTKIAAIVGEVSEDGIDIIGIGTHPSRGLRKGVVTHIDNTIHAIRRAVEEVLTLVHLEGMEERFVSQLSGGQQQRVSLARAIVYRPRLLLMDEPLGALDKKLREMMQIELKHIQQQVGITVLSVTHDQEEALTLSDRVAVLNQGHLEQIGTAHQLYEKPENRFVADFIGETNFLDVRVESVDADWITVSSPSIAEFRIPRNSHVTGTEAIQLSIRPEKIIFVDEPAVMECTARAIVKEIVYMGDTNKFYIQLHNGEELVVKQHNRKGMRQPKKKDSVVIGWDPANCVGLKQISDH